MKMEIVWRQIFCLDVVGGWSFYYFNMVVVETTHCELIDYPGLNQNKSNRSPKSISSFVAGFKSAATTRIDQFRGTPFKNVWQPRFWDRLIRDKEELARIRKYIQDNPAKWEGGNI